MFKVMFTNGLPLKEIKLINCCQNLEENEELQKFFKKQNVERGIKIFLLDQEDIKKTSGVFENLHIVDNKLWFDYGDKYLVVDELENETKKYFLDGNRKYILATINSQNNAIQLLAQYTLLE